MDPAPAVSRPPEAVEPTAPASRAAVAAEEPVDRELVERARQGEVAAFEALVLRHQDAVYRVALRIVGAPEEAEEAAQDAFVRAWRALGSFRGDSAFATWLHRVAVRVALDRSRVLRARRRREQPLEPPASGAAGAATGAAGSAVVARADVTAPDPAGTVEAMAVDRMLDSLNETQRAVVTLYYLEDRPVIEIAAALGFPENTVKTHLSRARAALRAAWQRGGGTRP